MLVLVSDFGSLADLLVLSVSFSLAVLFQLVKVLAALLALVRGGDR